MHSSRFSRKCLRPEVPRWFRQSVISFFRRGPRVLKSGPASRVVFFYQGEEGTYVDDVYVTVYENAIVHIRSPYEETTTHLQNCEILWRFAAQPQDQRSSKLRLLKGKEKEGLNAPAAPKGKPTREPPAPELTPEG